jgi:hypothetical protein
LRAAVDLAFEAAGFFVAGRADEVVFFDEPAFAEVVRFAEAVVERPFAVDLPADAFLLELEADVLRLPVDFAAVGFLVVEREDPPVIFLALEVDFRLDDFAVPVAFRAVVGFLAAVAFFAGEAFLAVEVFFAGVAFFAVDDFAVDALFAVVAFLGAAAFLAVELLLPDDFFVDDFDLADDDDVVFDAGLLDDDDFDAVFFFVAMSFPPVIRKIFTNRV